MKTENSHHYAKRIERHSLLLLLVIMFVFLTGTIHAAPNGDPPRYHESGKLTGVKKNNTLITVIISEREYTVDPSVLVVNAAGRPTSLDKLTIPADVNFEYGYNNVSSPVPPNSVPKRMLNGAPNTMSPVIVYIEEVKTNKNNGRSMQ